MANWMDRPCRSPSPVRSSATAANRQIGILVHLTEQMLQRCFRLIDKAGIKGQCSAAIGNCRTSSYLRQCDLPFFRAFSAVAELNSNSLFSVVAERRPHIICLIPARQ